MTVAPFDASPPDADHISSYDRRHLATYLRLLDAAEEGADWREATFLIFGLDAATDHCKAQQVYEWHLARARWMVTNGYRELLEGTPDSS